VAGHRFVAEAIVGSALATMLKAIVRSTAVS